jgi:hypothetical protein
MVGFKKYTFNQYLPAALKHLLKARIVWPISRFIVSTHSLYRELWLPIYRVERSGLTVIMIGNKACDPYIIDLFYGEYIEPINIGTVALWRLNREMQRSEENADLIIYRHNRFRPWGAAARRMLKMPYYVAQSVDLPPSDADLLAVFHNHATKSDFKRILIAEFKYEITQDPAQLNFFYHQMYRPFIQDRHRGSAQIVEWEYFRQVYGNMELQLILKTGCVVGGGVFSQTGDCWTMHVGGVLNADKELINAGVIASHYWFSLVEAHRRGCTTVNFLCARPFLKNGVLVYKKKWNARILMDHRERELWLLPSGKRPSTLRCLEENPFICEQDGKLVSLIFLGSHITLNDKELSKYLRDTHFQGDHLSTCIVILNSEWVARTAVIKNILREFQQPSRVLDLSDGSLTQLPKLIHNWQER